MEKLRLYIATYCPYSRRVTFFIKDHNLQNIEIIDINKDKEARDYLNRVGGRSQTPCLFIGEKPLYESNSIINYLYRNFVKE